MPLGELADLLEGKMLDHFAVEQLIGGGGMGAVFRGLDTRLDRIVAIKVIPVDKRDPAMLRRFRQEAQSAARLDHPNIARVYYVGEADQWDYIVFEFIDGINIRDLVEMDGPLSLDDAVFYTRQIAEALQHAHERGVVHRDIKPSNILVTATGIAKLVDMGLARDTSLERSTQDRTASGITLGTFDYISPEQARDPRVADVRSDLYSLGCSLFFMLTGNPPFPDGTALQKLLNHGSLPPPDPRGWRDDLPDELCEMLLKLMAKRPGDRYQRPADLINDLMLLAEMAGLPRSCGPTTFAFEPTVTQPTLLETHFPWLLAMGILLGSTLWLQSQSMSSGFVLPSIEFPSGEIQTRNPVGDQTGGLTLPSGSTFDGNKGDAHFGSSGRLTANMGVETAISSPETSPTEIYRSEASGPLRSPPAMLATPSVSAPAQVGPPAGHGSVTSEASGRYAESAGIKPGIDQTFPEPSFALPSVSVPATSGGSLHEPSITTSTGASPGPPLSSIVRQLPTGLHTGANPPYAAGSNPSVAMSASVRPAHQTNEHSVIVVSNTPPTDVPAQNWESSLHRAVGRLADQPGLGVIEIRGSVWLDRPLNLGKRMVGTHRATDENVAASRLLIRGSQDSDAKIEVARGVWNNIANGQGVIRIIDSALTLQNIQIQAVLNDTQSIARSIIQIQGNSTLDITGCTMTVQRDQPATTHLLSLGEVERDSVSSASHLANDVRSMKITLESSFIRGDCSLLQLHQIDLHSRGSVQISFNDCLVAIRGKAVHLVSSTGPGGVERIVRMFCQWSTFLCSEGFARLEYLGSELPIVGFSRTAQSCVFWSRPSMAHIAIVGESTAPTENPDMIFLQGNNNAYDQQTQTLCQSGQNAYRITAHSFREALQEGWFVERGNERAISWAKPLQLNLGFPGVSSSDFALTPTHFVPGFQSPNNPRTEASP